MSKDQNKSNVIGYELDDFTDEFFTEHESRKNHYMKIIPGLQTLTKEDAAEVFKDLAQRYVYSEFYVDFKQQGIKALRRRLRRREPLKGKN